MAYEIPGFSFTLPAGADFSSGAQFRFANVSSTGKAVNPSAGGAVVGVRYTKSKADEAATIVHSGIAIVEAGGEFDPGDSIATDNVGRAVEATSGNVVVGRALETSTGAGIQCAILLIPAAAHAHA